MCEGKYVGQKFTKFSKYVHFQKPQRLFEESNRITFYCLDTLASALISFLEKDTKVNFHDHLKRVIKDKLVL